MDRYEKEKIQQAKATFKAKIYNDLPEDVKKDKKLYLRILEEAVEKEFDKPNSNKPEAHIKNRVKHG